MLVAVLWVPVQLLQAIPRQGLQVLIDLVDWLNSESCRVTERDGNLKISKYL